MVDDESKTVMHAKHVDNGARLRLLPMNPSSRLVSFFSSVNARSRMAKYVQETEECRGGNDGHKGVFILIFILAKRRTSQLHMSDES